MMWLLRFRLSLGARERQSGTNDRMGPFSLPPNQWQRSGGDRYPVLRSHTILGSRDVLTQQGCHRHVDEQPEDDAASE